VLACERELGVGDVDADHSCAQEPPDHHGVHAHPPAGADDDERLRGIEVRDGTQRVPRRGDGVDRDARRQVVDLVGERPDVRGGHHQVLREPAVARQADDPAQRLAHRVVAAAARVAAPARQVHVDVHARPRLEILDAGSDLRHRSGDLVTDHARHGRAGHRRVPAAPHVVERVADAARRHADQHLARARPRTRELDGLEGAAPLAQEHRAHRLGGRHRRHDTERCGPTSWDGCSMRRRTIGGAPAGPRGPLRIRSFSCARAPWWRPRP
jgi:hypothetical protein